MRILFVSIILFFNFCSKAQDTPKFGISTNYISNLNFFASDGIMFNTAFDLKFNNHKISVSPLFKINIGNETNFFSGASISYKYFPNKQNKPLNFYLSADLLYTFDRIKWSKYAQFSTDFVFYNIDFKSNWNSLKTLVGYGIEYQISKHINISSNMNVGLDFYNYANETIVKANPEYSNKFKSGSIFSHSKVASIFKVGIGYEF